jgi:hypothetical protein
LKARIKREGSDFARSTGEPAEPRAVTCYMAMVFLELSFPKAAPCVMDAGAHLLGESHGNPRVLPGRAFSRRRGVRAALVRSAPARSRRLCRRRAGRSQSCQGRGRPKAKFFAEKTADNEVIDYHAAVGGGLQLVARDRPTTFWPPTIRP